MQIYSDALFVRLNINNLEQMSIFNVDKRTNK